MILNGIQVLKQTSDPFAGIPASEPPQQPTKLLDPLAVHLSGGQLLILAMIHQGGGLVA